MHQIIFFIRNHVDKVPIESTSYQSDIDIYLEKQLKRCVLLNDAYILSNKYYWRSSHSNNFPEENLLHGNFILSYLCPDS
jgi:hypothetical protein